MLYWGGQVNQITMANITPFEFDGNKVRLILRNDEPWFIAKDLCAILGIQNIRQNLSNLDEDEKDTVCLKDGTPGNPNTAISPRTFRRKAFGVFK